MPTFANVIPTPSYDGIPYAKAFLMPAAEGSLFNLQSSGLLDSFPLLWSKAISAEVTFAIQGAVATASAYVIMQTDWGDGVWVDLCWCSFSGLVTQTFVLSAGLPGPPGVIQQTRAVGTAPSPPVGSNYLVPGGRIRFQGKATITTTTSSSSSAAASPASSAGPGVLTPGVLVTIRHKDMGNR